MVKYCMYEMFDEDFRVHDGKVYLREEKVTDVKKNFFDKETILLVFSPTCGFCTKSIDILKRIIDYQEKYKNLCDNFNIAVYDTSNKQNRLISREFVTRGVPLFLCIDKEQKFIKKGTQLVGLPSHELDTFSEKLLENFYN